MPSGKPSRHSHLAHHVRLVLRVHHLALRVLHAGHLVLAVFPASASRLALARSHPVPADHLAAAHQVELAQTKDPDASDFNFRY